MSATVDFNQYHTGVSAMSSTQYSNIQVLSTEGRIGRFEYFFYSLILPFLVFWIIAAMAGIASHFGELGGAIAYVLLAAAFCAALIIYIQLTIQRCHDFNASGWLAVLAILPLASILFWLIPGSKTGNRFGYPPRPASSLMRKGVALLLLILVAVITFVALNHLGQ